MEMWSRGGWTSRKKKERYVIFSLKELFPNSRQYRLPIASSMQSNMVSDTDLATKTLEAEFEEVGTIELEDGGNRKDY